MSTLKVTNINAADGTSALSIADSTGVVGANKFTDLAGTGAPDFPNGLTLASNAITGNITGVTLDDYEEGSWTPSPGGASFSVTANSAKYTKIGNLVYITWYGSAVSISGASGGAILYGLPFIPLSSSTEGYGIINYFHGDALSGGCRAGYTSPASSGIIFIIDGSYTAASWVNGTKEIMIAGCYRTAA